MDSVVFGVGFAVLASLCSIAVIFSWQTHQLMIAVFGEKPARAQLGQRGWYVRPPDPPPEPAPPAAPDSARHRARVATSEPVPGSTGARALASGVEPAPGSFSGPAHPPADEPMSGGSGPPERKITDVGIAAGTHLPLAPLAAKPARESFKPPSLASPPNYAEQARRPAPDAEELESTSGNPGTPPPSALAARQTVRPPALPPVEPELHHGAPETTRKPGAAPISRERPAVTPRTDLATLARDLDAADHAQADQAPEPRVATTRPPPSSQQAPAASVTHAAVAPPASAPPWAPKPGIIAAGIGERPQGRHEARSERPPPHKSPQPARKPTLLGIRPPATVRPQAAPPPVSARAAGVAPSAAARPVSTRPLPVVVSLPPRAPEPPLRTTGESLASVALSASPSDDDFDFEDEETRVGPRPSPGALDSAAGAQDAAPRRRIYATLASTPSIVPTNGRPTPAVSVIEAAAVDEDEQRATLKPGDATALAATP